MAMDTGSATSAAAASSDTDLASCSISFIPADTGAWFTERAKHIPMRLTTTERELLRNVRSVLRVTDYTSLADAPYPSAVKRTVAQCKQIAAICSGLVMCAEFEVGREVCRTASFSSAEVAAHLQRSLEVARRHKIMNPEKMRTEYGKLINLLQDSMRPEVQELLGISLFRDIRTVHKRLTALGCEAMLQDPLLPKATMEIFAEGKARHVVDREIKDKERAVEALVKKYADRDRGGKHAEDLRQCIYSIADNHSYLRGNRDSAIKMIALLQHFFRPDTYEDGFSLAIVDTEGGSRLTHDHRRQYYFVLQSLSLWREILHDMFRLWHYAELDLLEQDSPYVLTDTGQGMHRVQRAPRTSKAIHQIIVKTQRQVGEWIGSSVVHLGDKNVPSALHFIDKYNQVSRILNPIVITLGAIDELMKNPGLAGYVTSTFGSADQLRKTILADFFRHGFDGAGGDNFFEAGSCIDGRLTSAWNWCQQLPTKPFYRVFLLCGFVGFDGTFD